MIRLQAWSSIKKLGADAALKKEAEKYCPDPCLGDPCRSVKRAIKGAQCEVVGPFQVSVTQLPDAFLEMGPLTISSRFIMGKINTSHRNDIY